MNDPPSTCLSSVPFYPAIWDTEVERDTCMAEKLGLSGEIRPVNRIEQRIGEAEKLGFKRILY